MVQDLNEHNNFTLFINNIRLTMAKIKDKEKPLAGTELQNKGGEVYNVLYPKRLEMNTIWTTTIQRSTLANKKSSE